MLPFICGICEDTFSTKDALKDHTAHHPDQKPIMLQCKTCRFYFDDQVMLESHQRLSDHASLTCDRCSEEFTSRREYTQHLTGPSGLCADSKQASTATPPKRALAYEHTNTMLPATSLSDEKPKCGRCQKVFRSAGQYNNHFLGCRPASDTIGTQMATSISPVVNPASLPSQPQHLLNVQVPALHVPDTNAAGPTPMQNVGLKTNPPIQPLQPRDPTATTQTSRLQNSAPAGIATVPAVGQFACKKPGCGKVFRSKPAMQVHDNDIHGTGDQKFDLHGKKSRTLGQKESGRLVLEGLMRGHPGPSRGRGRQPPVGLSAPRQPVLTTRRSRQSTLQQHQPAPSGPPLPTVTNAGGIADMEQAKSITGKMLRLLIQSDIFIRHDGSISACGIDWTRIDVNSQQNIVSKFEGMVHLPANFQHMHNVPFAKAFCEDGKYTYLSDDLEKSPARDSSRPGLGIVALACSKVILKNGAQEVVKIAAIDLITGRILMNHLVCTSLRLAVENWSSASTGLFSWDDIESARSLGYKVFKGWFAVRAALHRFVDRETIIVGHNLRPDLDSLRMSHGRAIDVAVMFERAANGPLTKSQLSLDSLSKDLLKKQLKSDPEYGRDVLMNAFAARQFVLWACKNGDTMKRMAIQKSLDLQRAGVRV